VLIIKGLAVDMWTTSRLHYIIKACSILGIAAVLVLQLFLSVSIEHPLKRDVPMVLQQQQRQQHDNRCEQVLNRLDYLGQIDLDLAPYASSGINHFMIDQGILDYPDRYIQVHIRNNRFFVTVRDERLLDQAKTMWRMHVAMLMRAACRLSLPDVDILMMQEDTYDEQYPVFHFQKKSQNQAGILIPYFSHLVNDIQAFHSRIREAPMYQWDKKEAKLFWRGASTNGNYGQATWKNKTRSKLVLACSEKDIQEQCDVGFYKIVQTEDDITRQLMEDAFSPLKSPVPMSDHNKYKLIAWLDGNGPCAGRSEHLLAGNSVLLKEQSSAIEFYYLALVAGKHYIPINADMSDLKTKLEWALAHEEQLKVLVENLHTFVVEQLSAECVDCYVQHVLQRYAALFTDPLIPMEGLRSTRTLGSTGTVAVARELFPAPQLSGAYFNHQCQHAIYVCFDRFSRPFDDERLLVGNPSEWHAACEVPKSLVHLLVRTFRSWIV
jgi:hypothetical protein